MVTRAVGGPERTNTALFPEERLAPSLLQGRPAGVGVEVLAPCSRVNNFHGAGTGASYDSYGSVALRMVNLHWLCLKRQEGLLWDGEQEGQPCMQSGSLVLMG